MFTVLGLVNITASVVGGFTSTLITGLFGALYAILALTTIMCVYRGYSSKDNTYGHFGDDEDTGGL